MAATREELRRELSALGPPEAVDVLMSLARDCIFLRRERCEDDAIPIGASKIGGAPDVPADFVWPHGVYDPMSFLAQIDLAEASPLDPSGLLPKQGLLSFFYELDAELHELPADERFCLVFHFAGGAQLVRAVPPHVSAMPEAGRWQGLNEEQAAAGVGPTFRPCRLAFEPLVQPPGGGFAKVLEPHWRDYAHPDPVQQLARAYDERPGLYDRKPEHKMLGFPALIQDDRDAPGQVLLLQLDSDEDAGILWGDVGALYCFVPEDDLRHADFSRALMVEDCY